MSTIPSRGKSTTTPKDRGIVANLVCHSDDDWEAFSQKNLDHGKFYFGKFHHSVHQDWYTSAFKNTCPPTSGDDYRNSDYQFWSYNNLRPTSVLNPSWDWGQASSPATADICSY